MLSVTMGARRGRQYFLAAGTQVNAGGLEPPVLYRQRASDNKPEHEASSQRPERRGGEEESDDLWPCVAEPQARFQSSTSKLGHVRNLWAAGRTLRSD